MQKYRYSLLSIALAGVLVGPFILKLKDPRLEIYPAIIFPSGNNLLFKQNSEVSFFQYDIYAHNPEPVKIMKKELLGPIPNQYFYSIYEGHFGLEKYTDEFKLYKPPIKFRIENNFSEKTTEATKFWLKQRLKKRGYKDSIFSVQLVKNTFNLDSRSIESKEIVNEKSFLLD